jgi:hypothetical protein
MVCVSRAVRILQVKHLDQDREGRDGVGQIGNGSLRPSLEALNPEM